MLAIEPGIGTTERLPIRPFQVARFDPNATDRHVRPQQDLETRPLVRPPPVGRCTFPGRIASRTVATPSRSTHVFPHVPRQWQEPRHTRPQEKTHSSSWNISLLFSRVGFKRFRKSQEQLVYRLGLFLLHPVPRPVHQMTA